MLILNFVALTLVLNWCFFLSFTAYQRETSSPGGSCLKNREGAAQALSQGKSNLANVILWHEIYICLKEDAPIFGHPISSLNTQRERKTVVVCFLRHDIKEERLQYNPLKSHYCSLLTSYFSCITSCFVSANTSVLFIYLLPHSFDS